MTLTACPVALDIKNHKLDERKPIVVEYLLYYTVRDEYTYLFLYLGMYIHLSP